eukprot:TRINITY_DN23764_c1_g1_i1.p1 TRINITY_DN23764_c1_g1~~TRINITY_DN23764_c1_g1_i1.p1  ORF type:complete len:1292 (+),score=214.33 TRINITY_DN23764_c1_g1_i1:147-4022(+)
MSSKLDDSDIRDLLGDSSDSSENSDSDDSEGSAAREPEVSAVFHAQQSRPDPVSPSSCSSGDVHALVASLLGDSTPASKQTPAADRAQSKAGTELSESDTAAGIGRASPVHAASRGSPLPAPAKLSTPVATPVNSQKGLSASPAGDAQSGSCTSATSVSQTSAVVPSPSRGSDGPSSASRQLAPGAFVIGGPEAGAHAHVPPSPSSCALSPPRLTAGAPKSPAAAAVAAASGVGTPASAGDLRSAAGVGAGAPASDARQEPESGGRCFQLGGSTRSSPAPAVPSALGTEMVARRPAPAPLQASPQSRQSRSPDENPFAARLDEVASPASRSPAESGGIPTLSAQPLAPQLTAGPFAASRGACGGVAATAAPRVAPKKVEKSTSRSLALSDKLRSQQLLRSQLPYGQVKSERVQLGARSRSRSESSEEHNFDASQSPPSNRQANRAHVLGPPEVPATKSAPSRPKKAAAAPPLPAKLPARLESTATTASMQGSARRLESTATTASMQGSARRLESTAATGSMQGSARRTLPRGTATPVVPEVKSARTPQVPQRDRPRQRTSRRNSDSANGSGLWIGADEGSENSLNASAKMSSSAQKVAPNPKVAKVEKAPREIPRKMTKVRPPPGSGGRTSLALDLEAFLEELPSTPPGARTMGPWSQGSHTLYDSLITPPQRIASCPNSVPTNAMQSPSMMLHMAQMGEAYAATVARVRQSTTVPASIPPLPTCADTFPLDSDTIGGVPAFGVTASSGLEECLQGALIADDVSTKCSARTAYIDPQPQLVPTFPTDSRETSEHGDNAHTATSRESHAVVAAVDEQDQEAEQLEFDASPACEAEGEAVLEPVQALTMSRSESKCITAKPCASPASTVGDVTLGAVAKVPSASRTPASKRGAALEAVSRMVGSGLCGHDMSRSRDVSRADADGLAAPSVPPTPPCRSAASRSTVATTSVAGESTAAGSHTAADCAATIEATKENLLRLRLQVEALTASNDTLEQMAARIPGSSYSLPPSARGAGPPAIPLASKDPSAPAAGSMEALLRSHRAAMRAAAEQMEASEQPGAASQAAAARRAKVRSMQPDMELGLREDALAQMKAWVDSALLAQPLGPGRPGSDIGICSEALAQHASFSSSNGSGFLNSNLHDSGCKEMPSSPAGSAKFATAQSESRTPQMPLRERQLWPPMPTSPEPVAAPFLQAFAPEPVAKAAHEKPHLRAAAAALAAPAPAAPDEGAGHAGWSPCRGAPPPPLMMPLEEPEPIMQSLRETAAAVAAERQSLRRAGMAQGFAAPAGVPLLHL